MYGQYLPLKGVEMRKFLLSGFMLLGVASGHAAEIKKPSANPIQGTINWVYDYAEGQRLSRSSGKTMFVVFRCER